MGVREIAKFAAQNPNPPAIASTSAFVHIPFYFVIFFSTSFNVSQLSCEPPRQSDCINLKVSTDAA